MLTILGWLKSGGFHSQVLELLNHVISLQGSSDYEGLTAWALKELSLVEYYLEGGYRVSSTYANIALRSYPSDDNLSSSKLCARPATDVENIISMSLSWLI